MVDNKNISMQVISAQTQVFPISLSIWEEEG